MKDFCLNFMKMVSQRFLAQQVTEKVTVEVETKTQEFLKVILYK